MMAGGEHHSIAVTGEGKVYCWGRNDEGQCGKGDLYGQHKRKRAQEEYEKMMKKMEEEEQLSKQKAIDEAKAAEEAKAQAEAKVEEEKKEEDNKVEDVVEEINAGAGEEKPAEIVP
jgi:alpha-tubulin suppressor-like RCC1 family protein